MSFVLKCQPCGAEKVIEGPNPRSAVAFMRAVSAAGWRSYLNNRGPGVVTFCSQQCCNAALTKDGFFRRDLGRGRTAAADRAIGHIKSAEDGLDSPESHLAYVRERLQKI